MPELRRRIQRSAHSSGAPMEGRELFDRGPRLDRSHLKTRRPRGAWSVRRAHQDDSARSAVACDNPVEIGGVPEKGDLLVPKGTAFNSAYFRKYYFNAATRVTSAAEMRGRARLIAA